MIRRLLSRRLDRRLLFPDYERYTILNIGRALKGLDVPEMFEWEEEPTVFVVDGLGYYMFRRFFGNVDGVLPISSVLPSSTAIALPALYSGELPSKKGYFGSFMRKGDQIVDVLREGVPVYSARATHLIPAYLRGRSIVRMLQGKIVYYVNLLDMRRTLPRVRGPCTVYIPELDAVAHEKGPYAEITKETTCYILRIIERVARERPYVVIVSDHGFIRTGRQVRVKNGFGDSRALLTDEPAEDMNAYRLFPDLALRLYGVEDVPAKYVVLPQDGTSYYFPWMEERLLEKTRGGMHGGATPEELLALYMHGKGKEVAELLGNVLKACGGMD